MPERIAAQDHGAYPEDAAEDIESEVSGVGHFGGAGYRGTERPNDGYEASENHGAPAILFVEIMGALEMAFPEEERIFTAIQSRACGPADPVANLVADDSAEHHGDKQPSQWDNAASGKNACGDQEGISGKEKADEETGLDKNDGANQRGATGAGYYPESVGVKKRVEELKDT